MLRDGTALRVALDVARLHELMDAIPRGRWIAYGDLAAEAGSIGRAVGGHIKHCVECQHAWRVPDADGIPSSGFSWTDATDTRTPREVLEGEGVVFTGNRADPARRIRGAELVALIELAPTDAVVLARARREQARLRSDLLVGAVDAPCWLCGRVLPARLLVAAHIVARRAVHEAQRRDPEIAFLACLLGCDALFEHGYVGVDDAGRVTRLRPAPTSEVAAAVDLLHGREAPGFTPARAARFAQHRALHAD